MITSNNLYYDSHKKLIAKAIEELQFEEILTPSFKNDEYYLSFEETTYRFQAQMGSFGNIKVSQESLCKFKDGHKINHFTISSFFMEAKDLCQMSGETLAQYIEEANQTIYSDMAYSEMINSVSLSELVNETFYKVDNLLSGHPKLIMNKGRIGFGVDEIKSFAPEFRNSFKLRWIALSKKCSLFGVEEGISLEKMNSHLFSLEESKSIKEKLKGKEYFIVPVHPWQWNRYIEVQFQEFIQNEEIIDLGELGSLYSPQASIRTLTNVENPKNYDVKVALSILNTSCVRGIPQKYIETGHAISSFIEEVISKDQKLQNVRTLKEVAAFACPHKDFQNIKDGSYRFKELLGCVFRESVESKLSSDEKAFPVAALLIQNDETSFIKELVKESKLEVSEYLERYFENVIVPLYHLQVVHGIGLVSHGQNLILITKKGIPSGVIIKDFHGDLRLSNESIHKDKKVSDYLDRLPSEYLIHDLITGHFISFLRYFSRLVEEEFSYSEECFYDGLRNSIESYLSTQGNVKDEINLLRPSFEKVLVNSVRFKAGYSETSQRLKPMLGTIIKNPLRGKEVSYE